MCLKGNKLHSMCNNLPIQYTHIYNKREMQQLSTTAGPNLIMKGYYEKAHRTKSKYV